MAYLIDLLINIMLLWLYADLFEEKVGIRSYHFKKGHPVILISAIIIICYFVLLEYFFKQSIGKFLFRIKVAKLDQSNLTIVDLIKRHLLDILELVLVSPIAFFSIMVSKNHQRLGDMLAKTTVIDK